MVRLLFKGGKYSKEETIVLLLFCRSEFELLLHVMYQTKYLILMYLSTFRQFQFNFKVAINIKQNM